MSCGCPVTDKDNGGNVLLSPRDLFCCCISRFTSIIVQVECTTLSRSLEAVKAELKQCLEQQLNLQAVLEQAHRESSHIKMCLIINICMLKYNNVSLKETGRG